MDPMESELHNDFATSDGNSAYDDHGWKEVVEYNGFETSDANHHEYNEWKEVVYSSKRSQKQKPADQAANGDVSDKIVPDGDKQAEDQRRAVKLVAADVEEEQNGSRVARDENVKAEETKKPKLRKKKNNKKKNTKVSLSEAAAKIDPSHLSEFLVKQALVSACVQNRMMSPQNQKSTFCFVFLICYLGTWYESASGISRVL